MRSGIILHVLLAAVLSLSTSSLAVVNKPAAIDSLRGSAGLQLQDEAGDFGSATIFMMGNILLEQGDLVGAAPFLAQAYAMNPDEVDVAETYRDVLLEMSYQEDALQVSRRLLKTAGDKFDTHRTHILILTLLKKYDDALSHLGKVQIQYPDSTNLQLLEGEILLRASRWEAAYGKYKSLRDLYPDNREAYTLMMLDIAAVTKPVEEQKKLWLGFLDEMPKARGLATGYLKFLVKSGDDKTAVDWAAKLAASPGDSQGSRVSWMTLAAGMIADAGRVRTSVGILTDLQAAGNLDLEAASLLARLHVRLGDLEAARSLLLESVATWPGDLQNRLLLGEIQAELGDYEAGMLQFLEVEKRDPLDKESYLARISLLSRQYPEVMQAGKRTGTAAEVAGRINALADRVGELLTDDDYSGHMILGSVKLAIGELDAAVGHYEIAARDESFYRDASLDLSLVLAELGRDDDAIRVLYDLHVKYPEDPVILNAYGYTLADAGQDLDPARTMIETALGSDPENPAYLDSMGWVLYRLGELESALDYLIRATNELPEDPVILEHLARTLYKLGKTGKAMLVVNRAISAGGNPEVLEPLASEIRNETEKSQ